MKRLLFALLVVTLLGAGCARLPAPPRPLAPPRPAARPAPPPDTRPPTPVVVAYLEALYAGRYREAYGLLDEASRQKHPYPQFAKQAGAGVTQYDLSTATVTKQIGERAVVNVRLLEDPASAGFHLRREQGAWRIVYSTGAPGFPYP